MINIFIFVLFCLTHGQDLNILELSSKLGAKLLIQFIDDAGLTGTLKGKGPFTVFAPTDKAFNALPTDVVDKLKNDKDLLTKVLTYHVVSGSTYSSQLTNDLTVETLNKGTQIRINIYGEKFYATGSQIILADQNATNGVIHVINKVIYPIPTSSLLEVAASSADLSTLVFAITSAKLEDTLKGGPFTVFAPNNEAFDKLPPGKLNELLQNQSALIDLLTYHVVSGTVYSVGLSDGQKVQTVEKKDVTVKIGGGDVMINDAKVITADVSVTNGVVHIIDTVLVPPS